MVDELIDFHTHILPGIDDGSPNVEESLRLLRMEAHQGVDEIVFTPHFYADSDGGSYIKRRMDSYERLMEAVNDPPFSDIKTHLGAEVYFFAGMSKSSIIDELCVDNGKLLLLEMPFEQWDKRVISEVSYMISDRGISVMIAHIERFYRFQKKKEYWNELMDMPVIFQMNGGAFLKGTFKSAQWFKFLSTHENVVLASDCHNVAHRPPNLLDARALIEDRLGKERLYRIDEYGKRIINELF